jgi:hypothetical protein
VAKLFGAAKRPAEAKVVCVWGMHRSGTSALTGVLQEWGVFLGDVRTQSGFNLKGNRENPDIRRLNDDVLKASGGSWHELPPKVSWTDEHRQRRDVILADYAKHDCWGFKDPRLLFTLDGWREVVPDLQFVGTFRHPLLVAQSLQKRNDFPISKGLQLWQHYNQRLLRYHQQFQFPVLSFDRAEPEYRESLQKLRQVLAEGGLSLKKTETEFFAEDLRHTAIESDIDVPPDALRLYRQLEKIAL